MERVCLVNTLWLAVATSHLLRPEDRAAFFVLRQKYIVSHFPSEILRIWVWRTLSALKAQRGIPFGTGGPWRDSTLEVTPTNKSKTCNSRKKMTDGRQIGGESRYIKLDFILVTIL